MGNILIALDDEHEKKVRKLAKQRYGGGKGSLQRVITESIDVLEDELKRKEAIAQLRETLERGFHMGTKGVAYKQRDELYD